MKATASYKSILQIAFPIMIGMLTQNIMQITNTAFLGRVGEIELGVSAMGGLFYMLLSVSAYGFANGAQILIARRMGQGKEKAIGQILNHSILIVLTYSVFAFIFIQIIAPNILPILIKNEITCKQSLSFLKIRSWGMAFTVFTYCFNCFYTGIGKTKVIMYSTLIATIVNIILDYGLIYGKLGMPLLNTDGAAISSIIAEFLGCVVLVLNILINKYIEKMNVFKAKGLDWQLLKNMLKLGSPLVIQYGFSFAAWYLFFIMIENMGDEELAISNILRSMLFLFTISCWAIGGSTNSLVSNLIGQNKQNEVSSLIKKSVYLSFIISLIMVIILIIFNKYLVGIYTSNSIMIEKAFYPSIIMGIGILILSVSTVLFQGVQGTGATKMNLITELIAVFLYCLYLLIIVKKLNLNISWAWAAEIVYWLTIFIISFGYLKFGNWKKNSI